MSEYVFQKETITALADAFRYKINNTEGLSIADMKRLMWLMHYNMENGVTFYDIDGNPIYSYSIEEAQTLTRLLEAPKIDGYTFYEWSLPLDEINTTTNPLTIHPVYCPLNTSKLMVTAPTTNTSFSIRFNQTDANDTLIDWGDGSAVSTVDTAGYITVSHTYATAGDYAISLKSQVGTISISRSVLYSGSIRFREVIFGTNVTSIKSAFNSLSDLAKVTILEGTTSIGASAFNSCSALTNINIVGNSITSIASYAISDCPITSITIPESVTHMEYSAFDGCENLTQIQFNATIDADEGGYYPLPFHDCGASTSGIVLTIGKNVSKLGAGLFANSNVIKVRFEKGSICTSISGFEGCTKLKNIGPVGSGSDVEIPDSVTQIDYEAFKGCTALRSVEIPDSVTILGSNAFFGCTGLPNITIPDSVIQIDDIAFGGCTGFTSITIPKNVVSMGQAVFDDCTKLSSIQFNAVSMDGASVFGDVGSGTLTVTIGKDVIKLGARLFESLKATEIYFEDNSKCQIIEDEVFYNCDKLTSIVIPASITSIGEGIFRASNALASVVVESGNIAYQSIDGVLYTKDGFELIYYPVKKEATSFVIPNGTKSISTDAFASNSNLITVEIPNSVTSIGDEAFAVSVSLANIEIPESVTHIGTKAFNDCGALTSAKINNGITNISERMFASCNYLTSVEIPNSVTHIGVSAFHGCIRLATINFLGTKSEWETITKGENWIYGNNTYTIVCTDGTISS